MTAPAAPPDLNQVLDAIVADLATLDGVQDCGRTGGRFDAGELRKFAVRAPAIRVAALAIRDVRRADTGEWDARAAIGVFVVTRDRPGVPREVAALAAVNQVLGRADLGRWGTLKVHPARELSAESLYSGDLQNTGVSIWAIGWSQSVRFGPADYPLAAFAGGVAITANEPTFGEAA